MTQIQEAVDKLPNDQTDGSSLLGVILCAVSVNGASIQELNEAFKNSSKLREACPLVLSPLVEAWLKGELDMDIVQGLVTRISEHGSPKELHALGLDVWINLWSKSCSHDSNVQICPLDMIRSCVGTLVIRGVARANKGSMLREKENYLLSMAGQLLSRHWLPESRSPKHTLSLNYFKEATFELIQALSNLPYRSCPGPHAEIRFDIVARLLASMAEYEAVCVADWFPSPPHSLQSNYQLKPFVLSNESFMSELTVRLSGLDPCTPSISIADRCADFETTPSDIALLVMFESLTVRSNDVSLVPRVWSDVKRADVYVRVALTLLNSDHVVPGLSFALRIFGNVRFHPQALCASAFAAPLVTRMIEVATSYGDESVIPLTVRQSVFLSISNVLTKADRAVSFKICEGAISRSRSDTAIGLFINIAKKVWSSAQCGDAEFLRIASSVLSDDYQVLDGIDSLKSLLNWARLVLGSGQRVEAQWGKFRSGIAKIVKQVDIEIMLLRSGGELEGDAAMQETRLVLVGHLLGIVNELLSTDPVHAAKGKCCSHSIDGHH